MNKDLILGYKYNDYKIKPLEITKIKVDYKFLDKDTGERIIRKDIISNNDRILYDILKKNNIKSKSIKLSLLYADDIVNLLKKKKKFSDKFINGWLVKYFPKYTKDIKFSYCSKMFINLKNVIEKEKFINFFKNNKDILNDIDYCSLA